MSWTTLDNHAACIRVLTQCLDIGPGRTRGAGNQGQAQHGPSREAQQPVERDRRCSHLGFERHHRSVGNVCGFDENDTLEALPLRPPHQPKSCCRHVPSGVHRTSPLQHTLQPELSLPVSLQPGWHFAPQTRPASRGGRSRQPESQAFCDIWAQRPRFTKGVQSTESKAASNTAERIMELPASSQVVRLLGQRRLQWIGAKGYVALGIRARDV